jgi:uncharacterized Zn finger protein
MIERLLIDWHLIRNEKISIVNYPLIIMLNFPNFEGGIEKKILDRGRAYYNNDSVEDVEDLGNGEFSAIVYGTEEYEIFIRIEGNHVIEEECDCPYTEEYGDTCKHIVAVLYYIRENEMYQTVKSGSMDNKISKILKTVPAQELKDYVTEYARKNRQFREDLMRAFK